jgi:hypothetical protein
MAKAVLISPLTKLNYHRGMAIFGHHINLESLIFVPRITDRQFSYVEPRHIFHIQHILSVLLKINSKFGLELFIGNQSHILVQLESLNIIIHRVELLVCFFDHSLERRPVERLPFQLNLNFWRRKHFVELIQTVRPNLAKIMLRAGPIVVRLCCCHGACQFLILFMLQNSELLVLFFLVLLLLKICQLHVIHLRVFSDLNFFVFFLWLLILIYCIGKRPRFTLTLFFLRQLYWLRNFNHLNTGLFLFKS